MFFNKSKSVQPKKENLVSFRADNREIIDQLNESHSHYLVNKAKLYENIDSVPCLSLIHDKFDSLFSLLESGLKEFDFFLNFIDSEMQITNKNKMFGAIYQNKTRSLICLDIIVQVANIYFEEFYIHEFHRISEEADKQPIFKHRFTQSFFIDLPHVRLLSEILEYCNKYRPEVGIPFENIKVYKKGYKLLVDHYDKIENYLKEFFWINVILYFCKEVEYTKYGFVEIFDFNVLGDYNKIIQLCNLPVLSKESILNNSIIERPTYNSLSKDLIKEFLNLMDNDLYHHESNFASKEMGLLGKDYVLRLGSTVDYSEKRIADNLCGYITNHPLQNISEDFGNYEIVNGFDFEHHIAELLKKLGFEDVKVTNKSNDYGVDIVASLYKTVFAFQCKYYSSPVGNKAVQEIYTGKDYYKANVGVLVTNNKFTASAISQAESSGIVLWDGDYISRLENSFLVTTHNEDDDFTANEDAMISQIEDNHFTGDTDVKIVYNLDVVGDHSLQIYGAQSIVVWNDVEDKYETYNINENEIVYFEILTTDMLFVDYRYYDENRGYYWPVDGFPNIYFSNGELGIYSFTHDVSESQIFIKDLNGTDIQHTVSEEIRINLSLTNDQKTQINNFIDIFISRQKNKSNDS